MVHWTADPAWSMIRRLQLRHRSIDVEEQRGDNIITSVTFLIANVAAVYVYCRSKKKC
ncbi:hypothetical protein FA13DRAFT_1730287 [Coprinellus micaceus]|uniref:Uncharacterized protein n=1 Tax=Coprinellus micaceus TaxID=71717 RepID=A0A4Y7TJ57_COPMI|nr:hypothetical protein FA13DRAFT_1730287 [Coprinellus micaceus]